MAASRAFLIAILLCTSAMLWGSHGALSNYEDFNIGTGLAQGSTGQAVLFQYSDPQCSVFTGVPWLVPSQGVSYSTTLGISASVYIESSGTLQVTYGPLSFSGEEGMCLQAGNGSSILYFRAFPVAYPLSNTYGISIWDNSVCTGSSNHAVVEMNACYNMPAFPATVNQNNLLIPLSGGRFLYAYGCSQYCREGCHFQVMDGTACASLSTDTQFVTLTSGAGKVGRGILWLAGVVFALMFSL